MSAGAVRVAFTAGLCVSDRSFAFFASAVRMARGAALIHLDRVAEGMQLIRTHLAGFDAFGAQGSHPRPGIGYGY